MYSDYQFGTGNFGKNGCMAIAIYNSLISMGEFETISNIQYEIDSDNGMLLDGKLGGNPSYVNDYLKSKGCEVKENYFPDQQTMESAVKQGDTAIIGYMWKNEKTGEYGAHYVAVEYRPFHTQFPFAVYNNSRNSPDALQVSDLSYLCEYKNWPIVVYTINKLEKEDNG